MHFLHKFSFLTSSPLKLFHWGLKEIKQLLDNTDSYKDKLQHFKKLEALPRNSAPSRHRNRCWVTGRSRAFYKDFVALRYVSLDQYICLSISLARLVRAVKGGRLTALELTSACICSPGLLDGSMGCAI